MGLRQNKLRKDREREKEKSKNFKSQPTHYQIGSQITPEEHSVLSKRREISSISDQW